LDGDNNTYGGFFLNLYFKKLITHLKEKYSSKMSATTTRNLINHDLIIITPKSTDASISKNVSDISNNPSRTYISTKDIPMIYPSKVITALLTLSFLINNLNGKKRHVKRTKPPINIKNIFPDVINS